MKQELPFNREYLGNGQTKLVRDIVLVKYVGKPLSVFPLSELRDSELMDRYRIAWQRLRIDNAFTILFMKTNVLHFMYTMSGRIDFIQLVAIIENMPEIENGFRENFSDRCFNLDVTRIEMNLYDYDMSRAVYDRKQKGFSSHDFVVELRAYLSIILALLGTGSGIYLCGYFARRLSALKNPDTAQLFERLILTINDNGGKNIYKWHTRQMLNLSADRRDAYIDMIDANGGCDPAYPVPGMFFDGTELESHDQLSFESKLKALGITRDDFDKDILADSGYQGKSSFSIPHHAWISAYIKHYPNRKGDIDRYRDEVISGTDRSWDQNRAREIDALGIALHAPLLHSVIPGLSTSLQSKSNSFAGLMTVYGTVTDIEPLPVSRDFKVPVREFDSFDRFVNAEVRSRINMVIINQVWRYVEDLHDARPNNVAYFVNIEYTKIREPLALKEQEYFEAGDALAKMADGPQRTALKKKAASLEKAVARMKQQSEVYESLLRELEFMNDREKIISCLIAAGKLSEPGNEFAVFTVRLLIERYASDATLQGRLNVLRSDVAVDLIHLRQLEMLVETIDGLARLVSVDTELEKTINSNETRRENLEELLAPFIIVRSKKLSMEAIDAALRRVTGFARLTAERARWQELLDLLEKKDTKFFEPYRLYASRTIMDAYYGDMGSICLSGIPEAIKDPSLQVIRLTSGSERKIKGIALMYRSQSGLSSYMQKRGAFWHAFAFNPIPSLLHHLTKRQQLYLYLNYRRIIEDVSHNTMLPVVVSGIHTWGIVSNDNSFSELILSVEKRFNAIEVDDAVGLSLFYSETSYKEAMVIVDPGRPETFLAEKLLENFSWDSSQINN